MADGSLRGTVEPHILRPVLFAARQGEVDLPIGVNLERKLGARRVRLDNEPPLVVPALEAMLKTSHLFNMLDARGAISVTERVGVNKALLFYYFESKADLYVAVLTNNHEIFHARMAAAVRWATVHIRRPVASSRTNGATRYIVSLPGNLKERGAPSLPSRTCSGPV